MSMKMPKHKLVEEYFKELLIRTLLFPYVF